MGQTPSTIGQAFLPDAASSRLPINGQHGLADGQGLHGNGQVVTDSMSQAPVTAHARANSGHKRPVSGQSLLDRAKASKRSRQGKVESQVEDQETSVVNTQTASAANGETPFVSKQSVTHQVSGSQLQVGSGSTRHSRQHSMYPSPHANVAQVLDLTGADDQATFDEGADKRSQVYEMAAAAAGPNSNASISDSARKRRRQTLLHSHRSSDSRQASADLVDLT